MISVFCKERHGSETLCESCSELLDYAKARLAKCPFGDAKPACRKCHVHCYAEDMRDRITDVMRFAGPRMTSRHPLMALRHMLTRHRRPSG